MMNDKCRDRTKYVSIQYSLLIQINMIILSSIRSILFKLKLVYIIRSKTSNVFVQFEQKYRVFILSILVQQFDKQTKDFFHCKNVKFILHTIFFTLLT